MTWVGEAKHGKRPVRSAPESIDCLIVVTDHGQIIGRRHQALQKLHLAVISVLKLVNQEKLVTLARASQNLRTIQQIQGAYFQIIKIQGR